MKKILLCLLVVFPISLMAQQKDFLSFFERYSGREGYTTVNLSSDVLQLMDVFSGEKDEALSDMMKNIESIHIVVAEKASDRFTKDIKEMLDKSDYKVISSINESGQKTNFYSIERNKRVAEFLMVSYGNNETVVINIVGDVDVKRISKIKW